MTNVKSTDISAANKRMEFIEKLPQSIQKQAVRLSKSIDFYKEQLAELEADQLDMLNAKAEEVALVLSMPGVGPQTALAAIAFLGEPNRFHSEDAVACGSGLVPGVYQSGTSKRNGKITKAGPSYLRRVLCQAAWTAIRAKGGEVFRELYERKLARCSNSGKAIIAVAKKMICILYSMRKNNTTFRTNIDDYDSIVADKLKRYKIVV